MHSCGVSVIGQNPLTLSEKYFKYIFQKCHGKYALFAQLSVLSGSGNDYIHFPHFVDLWRESGSIKSTLNHQAPLFCCHDRSPFWNLISWSGRSRADAILNRIIEVFFFFSLNRCMCVCSCVFFLMCLVLLETQGWKPAEGLRKVLQPLSFNLTRRREVSWKRKYVWLLLCTTWELIHCPGLLTTLCQAPCYRRVPTQHLNCIWTFTRVSKC